MIMFKKNRGSVIIEMTLIVPLFFLLLFAIVDGARMIFFYSSVAHGAREAVRYAVVRGTEAGQDNRRIGDSPATENQIEAYVQQRIPALSDLRVTTVWPLDENNNPIKDSGQVVQVTVEHDFIPLAPLMPAVTLTSTSSTVIYF
ncbi:MAG: pilus assembly protein [Aliivibrio sp.]|uniref:TadE/TadG family type IV pilus assembly protein n=1 Tax=Aliivibrio sp. TaxID=1872443 RepID=UPI001A4B66D6|nr:pilus assembly protein [Aliivibrio sp.]